MKNWLTPDEGKTVFLSVARCGSTSLIVSLRRKMRLPLLRPLITNHNATVTISHEDFGLWMDRKPENADIKVVMRNPIKRLISAHRLWQWKYPYPNGASYDRMREMVDAGSTENHIISVAKCLTKLKGHDYEVLRLEDADEWSAKYGFRMEHIAHSGDRFGDPVALTKDQEQRARLLYADDIQLGNY